MSIIAKIASIPSQFIQELKVRRRIGKYLEILNQTDPTKLKENGLDPAQTPRLNCGQALEKFLALPKTTRLAAYVNLMKSFNSHDLAMLTDPDSRVIEINERLVAGQLLIQKGVDPKDLELELKVVKDEEDFPITGKNIDKNTKENDGLLRAELAEALIKSGYKSEELIGALKEILNNMIGDPLLSKILENGLDKKNTNFYLTDFLYFLSELYQLDKQSAEAIMKPFGISEKDITHNFN